MGGKFINKTKIAKDVIKISIPLVISGLLQVLVSVVDVYMSGHLGTLEQAAVSLVEIIRLIGVFVAFSAASGVSALVSQAFGAGNKKDLSHIVEQALGLTIIFASIVSVIGYFSVGYLIDFMNNQGDPLVVSYGTTFMKFYFAGFILLMLNFVINASLQATGDTVTTMYLAIASVITNIGFSIIFTYGFGPIPALGLTGIILGTMAAWFVTGLAGLIMLFSGKKNIQIRSIARKPDINLYKTIMNIGIPSSLTGIAKHGARIFLFRIVNSSPMSSLASAALGIGFVIESLITMIPNAMGIATGSLFGQALGRWQIKRAKTIGNVAILLAISILTVLAILILIFAPQLVALFNGEGNATVIAAGSSFLRINALALPIYAVSTLLISMLRNAGDTKPAFRAAIIGRWLIMLGFAYITTSYFKLGIHFVWWAVVLDKLFTAVYMGLRWYSNKWQDVSLKRSLIYNKILKDLPQNEIMDFLNNKKARIMAIPEATEELGENEIKYILDDKKIIFRVENDKIKLVEGRDLLEQILSKEN